MSETSTDRQLGRLIQQHNALHPPDPAEAEETLRRYDAMKKWMVTAPHFPVRFSFLEHRTRPTLTTAIPTSAVVSTQSAYHWHLMNPKFNASLDDELYDFAFVNACHEVGHIFQRHTKMASSHILRASKWGNIACEGFLNMEAMTILQRREMPTINGEPTGINPLEIHAKALEQGKKQGLDIPKDPLEFWQTDVHAVYLLDKLDMDPNDMFDQDKQSCSMSDDGDPGDPGDAGGSGDGSGDSDEESQGGESDESDEDGESGDGSGSGADGDDTDGSEGSGKDGEQLRKEIREIIRNADNATEAAERAVKRTIQAAVGGSKKARSEMLDLLDKHGDDEGFSNMWGRLGGGRLRGEVDLSRRTAAWKELTRAFMASKLAPHRAPSVNRRITWETRIHFRTTRPKRTVLVAVDASGSMRADDLNEISAMVGQHPEVEAHFISWDGQVTPFEVGGIVGGGGTDCTVVDRYIAAKMTGGSLDGICAPDVDTGPAWTSHPDAVVVITDGIFAPFTPAEPDKWLFLITPGGTDWVKDHHISADGRTMQSIQLDELNAKKGLVA